MLAGSSNKIEQLKHEVELFLLVPSKTIITDYIYKVSVGTKDHLKEVYSESPVHNCQNTSQYKQLPKTIRLIFEFEVKQMISITVLHKQTMTAYGASALTSLNTIYSLRRDLYNIPIKNGETVVSLFGLYCTGTSSKSYQTTIQIDSFNMERKTQSWFCCSSKKQIQYYYQIYQRINNGMIMLAQSQKSRAKSWNFTEKKIITSKKEELKEIVLIFYQTPSKKFYEVQLDLTTHEKNNYLYINNKNERDGYFKLQVVNNQKRYSFLQFYKSGMELALVVAIDFTVSNHHYQQKSSLHYYTDNQMSVYQEVLRRVCPILLDFDSNKKVPVFGFGAIQRGEQKTSHYFPLAKNMQNYEVYQTEGVINIYKQVMPTLTFHGPSYFAPLIQENVRDCYKMKKDQQEYKILLILTDGEIYDYEKTVDLIVQCSQLPISIIIVGISKDPTEEWSLMQKLNNNNLQLKDSKGRKATRDMVTFVEYFKAIQTQGQFERQLLKQIPTQITQYHRQAKIIPENYSIRKNGYDAVDAQRSDIIKLEDRMRFQKQINPQQNKQQSMMKLPEKSIIKTKLRAKQFYQEKQE